MSKNKDMITKGVSFNTKNPHQKQLLDYALEHCGNNFSDFIKSLIMKEMYGNWNQGNLENVNVTSEPKTIERKAFIRSQPPTDVTMVR